MLVILLPMQEKGFDGFSAWAGDGPHRRPVVALMGGKTSYRSRFSSGEELGHIVMHTPLQTSARQADLDGQAYLRASFCYLLKQWNPRWKSP